MNTRLIRVLKPIFISALSGVLSFGFACSYAPSCAMASPDPAPTAPQNNNTTPADKNRLDDVYKRPRPAPFQLLAPIGSVREAGNRAGKVGNVLGWTFDRTVDRTLGPALDEFMRDLPPQNYNQLPNATLQGVPPEQTTEILKRTAEYCLHFGVPEGLKNPDPQAVTKAFNSKQVKELHALIEKVAPGLTSQEELRFVSIAKDSIVHQCLVGAGQATNKVNHAGSR